MRARREMEIIAGQINTSNAIITMSTGDFALSGSGGGVLTITFPKDFKLVSITGNGACIVMFDTVTKHSARVVTVNTVGGGAVGADIWFTAVGYRV